MWCEFVNTTASTQLNNQFNANPFISRYNRNDAEYALSITANTADFESLYKCIGRRRLIKVELKCHM